MWILLWLVFSVLVGVAGSSRKIGFGGALFLSLIFSPLVGLIAVALSSREEEKKPYVFDEQSYRKNLRMTEEEERKEYEHLQWMRDKGVLTEEEFKQKRDEVYRKAHS